VTVDVTRVLYRYPLLSVIYFHSLKVFLKILASLCCGLFIRFCGCDGRTDRQTPRW